MPCLPAEVILGVDTHRDTHAAVLVDLLGCLVAAETFPTTRRGLRALIAWAQQRGTIRHAGVEGTGSKQAALGMAFKLLKTAEERWRRFNGHELVADVLADVQFKDGIKVTEDHTHNNQMTGEKVAA